MSSKRKVTDERISAYRRAVQGMARGRFRPPLPAVVEGPAPDEVDRLGVALSRLGTALERRFAETNALIRLGEKVNGGLVLHEVLEQMFDSFHSVFPYDRIGCSLLEDDRRTVRAVWARSLGAAPKLGVGYSAPLDGSSLTRIIETGRPRILNDLEEYLREHPGSHATRLIVSDGVRSSLTCPLVAQGKRVGFVFFSSNRRNTYSERHVELLMQIAGQLSLVVEKGRLYAELLQAKTALEAANRSLSLVATLDSLTGVPNRRMMDEMLDRAWRRAMRTKTPLSLIMIDIDHFKEFNDRFGHLEGDRCLVRVAEVMRSTLRRPDDFIARYGGEEFLAFPAAAAVETALGLAERLRVMVEQLPMEASGSGESRRVTISAGVAGLDSVSDGSVFEVIASADRALYAAKKAGRNRVVLAGSVLPSA
ncbi:MAG: sensor domain-containing diguanylate cyclase [Thermoanaerobaculia bacterium]